MIEVRNLTKRYGSHEAVRGLSFDIPRGQVCGFLGPNGAGKSTTLRMLTGFLSPTTGSIRVDGIDALRRSIEARAKIGYMPEACPLYPELRVGEYLRYRAELKGVRRAEVGERVARAAALAAVDDVSHRIIGQLSKGYRQRVGLADALVADPPILVLDEPTAGLDPNQIRQVRELIVRLAHDKTVVLSTHILPEVEAICDRVLILHRGRLVSDGDPASLRGGIAGRESIRIVGRGEEAAFREALGALDGVRIVELKATGGGLVKGRLEAGAEVEAAERVFRAVAEAGLTLRELRSEHASLEDVFANLTTAEPAAAGEDEEE